MRFKVFIYLILIISMSFLVNASYCYQESANQSTSGDGNCGLNYSGSYSGGLPVNASFEFDGDWNTFSTFNRSGTGLLEFHSYTNYTIPLFADVNSSIFQFKNSGGTKNVTLGSLCTYSNNVLSFDLLTGSQNNSNYTYYKCDPSTSFYLENPNLALYEEAIYWNLTCDYYNYSTTLSSNSSCIFVNGNNVIVNGSSFSVNNIYISASNVSLKNFGSIQVLNVSSGNVSLSNITSINYFYPSPIYFSSNSSSKVKQNTNSSFNLTTNINTSIYLSGLNLSKYSFYVNDSGFSVYNYSCYQESANQSTSGDGSCKLNFNGNYNLLDNYFTGYNYFYWYNQSFANDGNLSTYALTTCSGDYCVSYGGISFVKPLNSIGAIYSWYNGSNWINYTINSEHFYGNANQLNIRLGFGSGYLSITYCADYSNTTFCGSSSTFYYNSFGATRFYEDAIYWIIPNSTTISGTSSLMSSSKILSSSVNSSVGWRYYVFDSFNNLYSSNLYSFVVQSRVINNVSLTVPGLFDKFSFSINVSDPDNLISYVNVSVTYPNASVYVLNSSLVNGFYRTSNLSAMINGTYNFTVFTDDGTNYSSSFVVLDDWSGVPASFTSIVQASQNFSFNISMSISSLQNLSFQPIFSLNNSNFSMVASNISFINNGSLPIIITTSALTPDGTYLGNLSIRRLIDNRTIVIPLSLGISTSFGVPFIVNKSDFSVSMSSSQLASLSFVVNNTGNYNLTGCVPSLSADFTSWSFVVFGNYSFFVPVNQSFNLSLTFSSPPPATYRGYLNVDCVASLSGVHNSLSPSNQPYIQLVSTYVPPSPSGGGGGSAPIVVAVSNRSLFVFESLSGARDSVTSFVSPGKLKIFDFTIDSLSVDSLPVSVSCNGDFCRYVTLSQSSFTLSGGESVPLSVRVVPPVSFVPGNSAVFDLVVVSGVQSRSIKVNLDSSSFSEFFAKFSFSVSPGDAGYWFSLGNVAVPKLFLYFILGGLIATLTGFVVGDRSGLRVPLTLLMGFVGAVGFAFVF